MNNTDTAPDSCPFCGAGIAIHDGKPRRCDSGEWAHYECGTWADVGLKGGIGGTTIQCRIAERERLTRERDEAKAERDRLRDWKESAMAVEREWNANAIATALGGQPGESQRAVIAREVPKLLARVKRLEEEVGRLRNYLRIAVGPDAHGW